MHRNKEIIFSINEQWPLKYLKICKENTHSAVQMHQRWVAVSEVTKGGKKRDTGRSFHWSQHYKAEYASDGLFLLISFMLCLMHSAIRVCVREMESCSWYFSFSFLECFEVRSAVLFFSAVLSPFSHVAAKSRRLNESVLSGWTESAEAFTGSSNESCTEKYHKPTWDPSLPSIRDLP